MRKYISSVGKKNRYFPRPMNNILIAQGSDMKGRVTHFETVILSRVTHNSTSSFVPSRYRVVKLILS